MFYLIAFLIGVVTNVMGWPIWIYGPEGKSHFDKHNIFILILCEVIFGCLWHCHLQLEERIKKLESNKNV